MICADSLSHYTVIHITKRFVRKFQIITMQALRQKTRRLYLTMAQRTCKKAALCSSRTAIKRFALATTSECTKLGVTIEFTDRITNAQAQYTYKQKKKTLYIYIKHRVLHTCPLIRMINAL